MANLTIALDLTDMSTFGQRGDVIVVGSNDCSYPYPDRISDIRSHYYELLVPISVNVYNINNTIYVADSEFYIWGSGEDEKVAVDDYEANLIDKYETLVENEGRLTRSAKEQFSKLKSYLKKVN